MSDGTVKSTDAAKEAIGKMQAAINGGLMDAITTIVTQGNTLDPELWAGPKADEFYSEWPETRTALDTAHQRLEMMANDIMTVNTNIQTAGGNQ